MGNTERGVRDLFFKFDCLSFAETCQWLGRRSERAGMLPDDRAFAIKDPRSHHEKPHQNVEEHDVSGKKILSSVHFFANFFFDSRIFLGIFFFFFFFELRDQ